MNRNEESLALMSQPKVINLLESIASLDDKPDELSKAEALLLEIEASELVLLSLMLYESSLD